MRWRAAGDLPPAALGIVSPRDLEARYAQKREDAWNGYKVHWTETCDPDQPHLITEVTTTPAPGSDQGVLLPLQQRLAAQGLAPGIHLVDAGYVEAASFVAAQQAGLQLVAPPPGNTSWQARAGAGYAAEDFTVDWDTETAVCPKGHASVRWQQKRERDREVIRVHFARATCAACPARPQCTRGTRHGRFLTLLPRAQHEALHAARAATQTPEFPALYRLRTGIEGTHSQAIRRCGARRCRYLGFAKTQLQHLVTGAALNLLRLGYWFLDRPLARTRQQPFIGLLKAMAT